MGVYIVTLPEGAYTTQDGANARVVVADNSTDAIAMARRFSVADGAPWESATAALVTGSADFSSFTFGFIVPNDADNGFSAAKHVTYTPLATDTVNSIGAGLLASALAAGLTLSTYSNSTHKLTIPLALNCGKSAITIDAMVSTPTAVLTSDNRSVSPYASVTLTGTSIKPTVDVPAGSAGTARNIDLTPLTTGINPTPVAEIKNWY